MARILSIVVLLTASCFGGFGCGGSSAPAPASAGGANVAFSLPSSSGDLVTVPVSGARHTVLDFFGPTCEPCAKKVPALVNRRAEIEQRGGRLVLVAVLADGETTSDAERALATWGVKASFLVDRAGVSLREAGVKALPSTIIVDAKGAMQWRAPAAASADDVLHALP